MKKSSVVSSAGDSAQLSPFRPHFCRFSETLRVAGRGAERCSSPRRSVVASQQSSESRSPSPQSGASRRIDQQWNALLVSRSRERESPGRPSELFVWPRARDYDRGRSADFEEDELKWEGTIEQPTVDLQGFPSEALDRCIIVAGPGYGKSALLGAIAARLVRTPYVPILVPLASFATSDVGVLKFLTNDVNRELEIRVEWSRLAEQGLVVLLFDGLDEIPAARRQAVLGRIETFSARHPGVPWLLTVRDPAVLVRTKRCADR